MVLLFTASVAARVDAPASRDSRTIAQNVRTNAPPQTQVRPQQVQARAATQQQRALQNISARAAAPTRNLIPARAATSPTPARAATTTPTMARAATTPTAPIAARAATPVRAVPAAQTARAAAARNISVGAISSEYNICRDAYFTCMDQFCAQIDPEFRRCACSARLDSMRDRMRTLRQTTDSLQDFADLNIMAIELGAAEVTAMLTATAGETAGIGARATDTSASASAIAGISDVLAGARSSGPAAAQVGGRLDIAGDVSQIWMSTDLIGGADIAQMTGARLFEQVHAQCIEIAREMCPNENTLNMVIAAYGMAIEQDCNAISASIDAGQFAAMDSIRMMEREMQLARLDNFDAQNATGINECIAQVRRDITSASACGPGFVHCLDITGRFLNRQTGLPILGPDLVELGQMIDLSGDILRTDRNMPFIAMIESMRPMASRGLSTCQMIADNVWSEFTRQAIIEIYQGQQSRVRNVRAECLDILNTCFDENLQSLRDFSGLGDQVLLGARVELSEELCHNHLQMCNNLYGGQDVLIAHIQQIGTTRIAEGCLGSLSEFARLLCTPIGSLSHTFPWGCRILAPGSMHDDNPNSIFRRLENHARDNCVRPSERDSALPVQVLADISEVLSGITTQLQTQLMQECESPAWGGRWSITPLPEHSLTECCMFHNHGPNPNIGWGHCEACVELQQLCPGATSADADVDDDN